MAESERKVPDAQKGLAQEPRNINLFSLMLGGGEGGVRGAGRGARFFFVPGGAVGVLQKGGGRGGEGAGRMSVANWGMVGRGRLHIFFRGRNSHQEKELKQVMFRQTHEIKESSSKFSK